MSATHINAGIAANSFLNAKAEIGSYKDAAKFLGKQNSKIIGSNVLVHKIGKAIAIQLYNTDIVIYFPNGTFSANNGGFNTPTTTTRLNQFGPKGWQFAHSRKLLIGWKQLGNPCKMNHDTKYPV